MALFQISKSVLSELQKSARGTPDLESARGSLFISRDVPAACIRLKVPLDDFLRHLLDLPGFSQAFRVLPVQDQPFDIVILGNVTISENRMLLDGKASEIL